MPRPIRTCGQGAPRKLGADGCREDRVGARLLAEVFGDLSLCVLPNLNPGTALNPGQLGLSDPYRPGVPAGGRGLERRWVNLFRALKEAYSSEGKRTF